MSNDHYRFSASAADRWMACVESINLCEQAPKQPPSLDARTGTVAHNIGAGCLRTNTQPSQFLGQVIDGVAVTKEMVEAVTVYVDYCRTLPQPWFIETKLLLIPEVGGTADFVSAPEFGELVVVDFKHGAGVFVEEDTWQLRTYLAAWSRYSEYTKARGVIVQPRCYGDPIREQAYSMEELAKFQEQIQAVKHSLGTTKPCLGDHCAWCAAKAADLCPAHRQALAVVVPEVELPPIADWPPEQLVKFLDLEKAVNERFAMIRARAMDLAGQGLLPGKKLVAGRKGARKWKDATQAVALLQTAGVNPFEAKMKSPAAIERELGKKNATILADLTEQTTGRPILVGEDNPKPALVGVTWEPTEPEESDL